MEELRAVENAGLEALEEDEDKGRGAVCSGEVGFEALEDEGGSCVRWESRL
jgi:hypothetical protein